MILASLSVFNNTRLFRFSPSSCNLHEILSIVLFRVLSQHHLCFLFQLLTPSVLVGRLINAHKHLVALQISEYLGLNQVSYNMQTSSILILCELLCFSCHYLTRRCIFYMWQRYLRTKVPDYCWTVETCNFNTQLWLCGCNILGNLNVRKRFSLLYWWLQFGNEMIPRKVCLVLFNDFFDLKCVAELS